MYQKTITEREAGTRLDKYLHKLLPEAGSGFIYKMLRKKNIVLNDKKADGSEKISCGDVVSIYFKDETLSKFMGTSPKQSGQEKDSLSAFAKNRSYEEYGIGIIYENDHILIADKPAGILTQKAASKDNSLNEWLVSYLLASRQLTQDELNTFHPSACNRLDRNTSGIVLCAKSVHGAQMLSEALKSRNLHKFYMLYAKGSMTERKQIDGYLYKDEKNNKVQIYNALDAKRFGAKASYIKTGYRPVRVERDKTLIEAELITGKPHQIRAHLASIGAPLLGDYKYGDKAFNDKYREKYGITHQLLHAYRVVFPALTGSFADISEKTFYAPLPELFEKVSDG